MSYLVSSIYETELCPETVFIRVFALFVSLACNVVNHCVVRHALRRFSFFVPDFKGALETGAAGWLCWVLGWSSGLVGV